MGQNLHFIVELRENPGSPWIGVFSTWYRPAGSWSPLEARNYEFFRDVLGGWDRPGGSPTLPEDASDLARLSSDDEGPFLCMDLVRFLEIWRASNLVADGRFLTETIDEDTIRDGFDCRAEQEIEPGRYRVIFWVN